MAGTDGKARGMKEHVDVLEKRIAALEKRANKQGSLIFNGAKLELALEKRVDALEDERLERDVPPPAEPPGSPTVEEAEDGQGKSCSRCAMWQPIPYSLHREGTCGKYGRPTVEVTKADDTCGDWRTREPDQPRRECWEHRKDGEVMFWSRVQHDDPDCTQHRMVELSDGEGIAPVAMIELASRYLALQSERDNLKILNENKAKSIGRLCAQLRKEQDERIQLRARVAELEALLENNKALSERVAELEALLDG